MSKLEVNAIDSVGSTLTLGDTNATTLALNSSITTLPSSLKNQGSFSAYNNTSGRTISNQAWTKMQADTELFDTDSWYDGANSKFQPLSAGKYFIYVSVQFSCTANSMRDVRVGIWKSGTTYSTKIQRDMGSPMTSDIWSVSMSEIIDMNGSTDYVEGYGYVDFTSGTPSFDTSKGRCVIQGYKLI